MFRKIRNRILMLNMVMVSSVVIFAFVAIFVTTYARVQNENREKLLYDSPSHQMAAPNDIFRQENIIAAEPGANGAIISGFATRISPDAGLSFSLLVDSHANVVEINSLMELQPETYTLLAARAMEAADNTDAITMEGRIWQYKVSQVTIVFMDAFSIPPVNITVPFEYSHIRFLDVTDSYSMIRSLAFMLSGFTLIIIAVFFLISYYFAGQAIRPMEEAWEKQSRFIADASHELKTPLSVISANCGVLYTDRKETVENQLKWVDSIMRASDRMTGLVNSLLSLVSMEDAQFTLQNSPVGLSEAVTDATAEIEAASFEKGLIIHRKIEPGIEIASDREHVRQLLSILLDNAVKYTDEGGAVTVSLTKDRRHVTCTIRNSGEGIPAENLPRLFDRFFRGDPARSSETSGYGLGLAIAKAIASQLSVSISAESILGEYTEFKLIF